MSESYFHWPTGLLVPAKAIASPVAFTRSGGRSLGGIDRNVRSDRGFWRISLNDVSVRSPDMRRTWNAIRTQLGGKVGLVVVPVWSFDSAPYASGHRESSILSSFDDGSTFDDGSEFYQGAIDIEMANYAPLGSTIVTLRQISASGVSGIRFSYQHALYETGPIIAQPSETTFQVSVFPAIRQAIPAAASLECDNPTCLAHLADDRGMDLMLSNTEIDNASVEFVEAVDYWNDRAIEDAA
jgi:hypothetical protein